MPKPLPPMERIMRRVIKRPDGCWEWIGKCRTGLYGEYGGTRLNGKMMSTHRAMWILIKGYVPKDLLHQCPLKLCCNPDHLNEGDQRQNLLEAVQAKGGGWGFCNPKHSCHEKRKS